MPSPASLPLPLRPVTPAGFTRNHLLALVLPFLDGWAPGAAEGSLRLLFLAPPDELRGRLDLAEPVRDVDELFVRDVAGLIDQIGTPSVLLVVRRGAGEAKPCDRRLWKGLRTRSDPPGRLAGLLVMGPAGPATLLGAPRAGSQPARGRAPAAYQLPRVRLPLQQVAEQPRE